MNNSAFPNALRQDSILNGRYIIRGVLGQGGFGITYKAFDYQTDKTVAIKEYYPAAIVTRASSLSVLPQSSRNIQDFENGKKQFLEEARTLSEFIGNPNIVRVYSYFEDGGTGTAYFVMEYVEGRSLSQYLREKGGRISWEEAWELLLPVADALSEVHKKKIVHRDIKPDNIIITADRCAKLLDFGAARYVYGVQSKSLEAILTPGFAPAEQYYRRGHQGPWTDVYALAATIYFCITGNVPPEGVERIISDTLKSPTELGIFIPGYAEASLLKALSAREEDRCRTMEDFKQAVQRGEDLEKARKLQEEQERQRREKELKEKEDRLEEERARSAEEEKRKEEERKLRERIRKEIREEIEKENQGGKYNTKEGKRKDGEKKKTAQPVLLSFAVAIVLIFLFLGRGYLFNGSKSGTSDSESSSSEAAGPDSGLNSSAAIDVCIGTEPYSIDPAFCTDQFGQTLVLHTFAGLAKWEKKEDGSFEIAPDCAEELTEGVENGDGTLTYTYTLRDGLKWSDGQPLRAGDFEFAWKRAANPETGSDYAYMFEQIAGYERVFSGSDTEQLAVKALDDRTLEVTLNQRVSYWNELLAFPAFMPVREDVVRNESWAADPSTYIGNGPYAVSGWQHNSVITMVKNPNYHDADKITMPAINFYMSDDANNMLTNFENGSWKLIDDVPINEIAVLKEQYPSEFVVTGQMGTYFVCWNVNEDILPGDSGLEGARAEAARAEIRNAISLLFDRNFIVDEVTQNGGAPASSFVSSGLTDADGVTDFSSKAGRNDGFAGYYNVSADALESNYAAAIEVLKKYYDFDESTQKFRNFPPLTYLYNTSEGHMMIAEYLQSALAAVGITLNLEDQEWSAFLDTRHAGSFSLARNGWLCDYNDPISMLDIWVTSSGNNDCQLGRGAHKDTKAYSLDLTDLGFDTRVVNGTWAETYDVLIADIKACTDNNIRYQLMHRAEDLLMSTGVICPLYYYTDLYMIDDSVKGFFRNPLGLKYFMYCTME